MKLSTLCPTLALTLIAGAVAAQPPESPQLRLVIFPGLATVLSLLSPYTSVVPPGTAGAPSTSTEQDTSITRRRSSSTPPPTATRPPAIDLTAMRQASAESETHTMAASSENSDSSKRSSLSRSEKRKKRRSCQHATPVATASAPVIQAPHEHVPSLRPLQQDPTSFTYRTAPYDAFIENLLNGDFHGLEEAFHPIIQAMIDNEDAQFAQHVAMLQTMFINYPQVNPLHTFNLLEIAIDLAPRSPLFLERLLRHALQLLEPEQIVPTTNPFNQRRLTESQNILIQNALIYAVRKSQPRALFVMVNNGATFADNTLRIIIKQGHLANLLGWFQQVGRVPQAQERIYQVLEHVTSLLEIITDNRMQWSRDHKLTFRPSIQAAIEAARIALSGQKVEANALMMDCLADIGQLHQAFIDQAISDDTESVLHWIDHVTNTHESKNTLSRIQAALIAIECIRCKHSNKSLAQGRSSFTSLTPRSLDLTETKSRLKKLKKCFNDPKPLTPEERQKIITRLSKNIAALGSYLVDTMPDIYRAGMHLLQGDLSNAALNMVHVY
ncbi:MAG TPA: hypothetical protein PLV25_05565, partial [Opitutales bacterium]|nr:hypothetical protein [Opitutales bacterium]